MTNIQIDICSEKGPNTWVFGRQDANVGELDPVYAVSGIADIVVHVDGSARDEAKLAYAEKIADAAGAHLTTFLANHISLPLIAADPAGLIIADLWAEGKKAGDEMEARLRDRFIRNGRPADIRRVDSLIEEILNNATSLGRTADLFVLGRPYGEGSHRPDLMEAVLFDAGMPVLIVPPTPANDRLPRTVVIAWRDCAECARAVAAALPFIKAADEVYLALVENAHPENGHHRKAAAAMALHLARHRVRVEVLTLPHTKHVADALVTEARRLGAEMIVAGAYSHSRIRELMWGGVTRELLTMCSMPLLLSH